MNLVANARDAMPRGRSSHDRDRQGHVSDEDSAAHPTMRPGRYALVAVSDTGIGIDAATLAHVFEPFFTTKSKGTGLGLATVHGIVRQAGGHIFPFSAPGHGSTFKVFLPATRARRVHPSVPAPAERPPAGTETILVVEDEEAVRQYVRRALESHGYTIVTASDGAEALAIVRQPGQAIAALVTDVVLPGISDPTWPSGSSTCGRACRCCSCRGMRSSSWSAAAPWGPPRRSWPSRSTRPTSLVPSGDCWRRPGPRSAASMGHRER